jgi:MFS family permease
MGYLTAVELLPYLLLSLPVGVWLDRRGQRRRRMVGADVARVLLLVAIPLSAHRGVLGWTLLYVIAGLVGACQVVFSLAYPSMVTAIVPPKQFLAANTLLQGSRAAAQLVGPALAGFLVQALSAPVALVADAASFAASAVGLATIHPSEPPPVPAQPGDVTEGFRFIWTAPSVRFLLLGLATVNLFNYMFVAQLVLYVTRALHVDAGMLGLIFSVGAAGTVLGALTSGGLSRRLGAGKALALGTALFTVPLMLVPLASGPHPLVLAILMVAEVVSGLGVMMLDINFGSLSLALVPDDVRARAAGAFSLVNYGIRPLGALLGGWLPTALGLRGTLWVATVGASLGVLWLLVPQVRHLTYTAGQSASREMPR